jgi:hypothetical protein
MIGCLILFPIAGFLALMGVYMSTMMAYFIGLTAVMGAYASAMAAYFTAFFIIMFG